MEGESQMGLIVFLVFLVGAWVVLRYLTNVIVWPVIGELWFPLVIVGIIVAIYLLTRRRA
jgi:hypothetical protein